MAARVGERLRTSAFSGRTVTLKLRRYDFTTLTRSQTLPQPTDDPRQIASMARRLLADAGAEGGLRLLGVGVSGLSVYAQGDLFAEDDDAAGVPPPWRPRRRPPPAEPPLPGRQRWWPGQDVRHEELGAGWVWGRGLGRVTVRFEGPLHRAGAGAHTAGRRPAAAGPPTRPTGGPPAVTPERSWWGWGTTDRALHRRRVRRAARPLLPGPARPAAPGPDLADVDLPAPRVDRRRRPCRVSTDRPTGRATPTARPTGTSSARCRGPGRRAGRRRPSRATEDDVVRLLDWAGVGGRRRRPVRRRQLGRRRGRVPRRRGPLDLAGPHRAGPGAGDRPGQPGGADPGRRARPGAGGAAAPARPDAAALPAELRVLHARRLARHPRRRPLRHPAHPHRRPGRVDARGHARSGVSESWRLPGSGAGPSPDRLFLGSEGTLGVITEAWMRLQDRPAFKASASVRFADMTAAMAAVRAIAQSGLHPANCRLLDPGEAALVRRRDGGRRACWCWASSRRTHPVEGRLDRAARRWPATTAARSAPRTAAARGDAAADAWRSAFLRMPYVRDGLARMSAIVETFETACTWDRVEELYATVRSRGRRRGRARSPARPGWSTAGSPTSTPTARRRTSR